MMRDEKALGFTPSIFLLVAKQVVTNDIEYKLQILISLLFTQSESFPFNSQKCSH